MNIKTLLALLLIGLSMSAGAEFKTVAPAYEVALSNFRAPASENGGATFKPCSECEFKNVRVTAATQYAVNGSPVRLPKFRQAIMQVRDRDEVTVVVKHHLESDTIVSIRVTI